MKKEDIMPEAAQKILLGLIMHLKDLGINIANICTHRGVPFDHFINGTERFTEQDANCIWQHSVEETNNEILGYHIGKTLSLANIGLLGMIIQNSPNLFEVFSNLTTYMGLITDIVLIDVNTNNKELIVTIKANPKKK